MMTWERNSATTPEPTTEVVDLEHGPTEVMEDEASMMENETIAAADNETAEPIEEHRDDFVEVMEDEPVVQPTTTRGNIDQSMDISVTSENCKIINQSDQTYTPCPDPEGATTNFHNGMNRNYAVPDSPNLTPVKLETGLKEQDTFTSSPTNSHDEKIIVKSEDDDEGRPLSRRQQRLRVIKCYAMVAVVVLVCAIGIPTGAAILFKKNNTETTFAGSTEEVNSPSTSTSVQSDEVLPPLPEKVEEDDDDDYTPNALPTEPTVLEVGTEPPATPVIDDEEGTTDPPLYEDEIADIPMVVTAEPVVADVDLPSNTTVADHDEDLFVEKDVTSETEVPVEEDTDTEVPVEEDADTDVPSFNPTASPSAAPSLAETQPQTPRPTGPDRTGIYFDLINITSPAVLQDTSTPQALSYLWLVEKDQILPIPSGRFLLQRYILVLLDHALHDPYKPFISDPTRDHCLWEGVVCDIESGDVKEINWRLMGLNGKLVEELQHLDTLDRLDLSENSLQGTLDHLYAASNLRHVYLHNNQLTGGLTEQVGQMINLESLYLSHNQLEGYLPLSLRSAVGEAKPLKWLVLSHNKFTGYLPPDWRMRSLFYLDLGHNLLSGPLPNDWDVNMVRLRHLYLDHNQFTGLLPAYFGQLGNGRIKQIYLNDNDLEGKVPDDWSVKDQVTNIAVHNNRLTVPVASSVCELSVFELGNLVELRTNCDICTCDFLCEMCVESGEGQD